MLVLFHLVVTTRAAAPLHTICRLTLKALHRWSTISQRSSSSHEFSLCLLKSEYEAFHAMRMSACNIQMLTVTKIVSSKLSLLHQLAHTQKWCSSTSRSFLDCWGLFMAP